MCDWWRMAESNRPSYLSPDRIPRIGRDDACIPMHVFLRVVSYVSEYETQCAETVHYRFCKCSVINKLQP